MARVAVLPQKIISQLEKTHLLTVGQIIEKLKKSGNTYNKTSIYRALEKLEIEGKICKENFGESEALYELRKNHHDHAVCTNCDKVVAVECHDHTNKKIPGFQADHHHTTIYGLCDSCVKKS
ncbi:MAG: transcriptional repressor [Patescibacteria group bacterium]|nr:MAG: transcriptional repressor [Patescibacteria group bacterium]